MAIVPLPLPPGAEARVLLHHLLEEGDILGRDSAGRTIIQLAVDDWMLDKLMTFDAEAAELEDEGDGEPDDNAEEDSPPAALLEVVRTEKAWAAAETQRQYRGRRVGLLIVRE